MKRFLIGLVAAVALLAAAAPVYAQAVNIPKVTTINPGTDLIQIIPGGQPSSSNVYATVAQVRGGNSTNGITSTTFRLLDFKNNDGTTLAVSASSGKFGLTSTPGTVEQLLTEAANSNTKTDIAQYEYLVPSGYVAGQNITISCNTDYLLGSGTVGTHTLAAAAYLTAAAGTQGSTLIATAAQTVPAAPGTVSFTITGATLSPANRLMLTFTLVIQDTGGSNITAHLNSCVPS